MHKQARYTEFIYTKFKNQTNLTGDWGGVGSGTAVTLVYVCGKNNWKKVKKCVHFNEFEKETNRIMLARKTYNEAFL
jgi:hypothetical protein